MKNTDSTPEFDAEDQAALWAARLDGSTLSAADRAELEAWLAKDPRHRALLSQYCQFSSDLEDYLPALVGAGAVSMPELQEKPAQSRWAKIVWIGGLSLAAAAAVALTVRLNHSAPTPSAIATTVGKRATITLDDGTKVDLNAQTNIAVELTGAERHVRLASGEAFFSVHKDPSRPFIVETPAGSVRVTGTQFNVRSETTQALDVVVLEGSVQVRPGIDGATSAPVALTARDHLAADAKGVATQALSAQAVENALAWRRGQLVFDQTPLSAALARFARYHGRAIVAAPSVADLHVGGTFSLDDLDEFLVSIESVLPVHVMRDSSGAIRVEPRLNETK